MKKIFLLIFCMTNIFLMFSQSQVTLVLRNGDTLRGYCKINAKEKIVFTKPMDDKKRFFDHKEIKQALIYENGKIQHTNIKSYKD